MWSSTLQINRKIQRITDGLGRLITVNEQDVTTGALTQSTSYSYDYLNKLTQVNQGGQTRSYKYDALGRLLYERIPERSATINDGTGTFWSCKYTYTTFSAVATRQDARSAVTTYGYDSMNRLTSISYSVPAGVAATPSVSYNYDNSTTSTTKGLLLSVTVGTSYSESYGYDGFERVSSITRTIDGRSYGTSYQYNTASQRTQLTYPSGRQVKMNHDGNGRLLSLTEPGGFPTPTYLNNISYNPAGQVTGDTLGNGVVETFGYDSQRMQLTSQNAGKPGYAPLMSLAYSYQAQAGQSGTGTTAGNSGQLMGITCCSSIGGSAELASYTYDDLGRLVTSNQTSNAATAQRRFAYDRWGNRTGVWDAVTGGNQIQSVTLQQSGGAPTNQIATVNAVGYSYDAAGNVTNDGAHSYTYDAENRLVNVDGGATGQYTYDHQNRRVKKVAGASSIHYIWEGSQVIAENSAATGAQIIDYVYAGSKLIGEGAGTSIAFNASFTYMLSDRLSARMLMDQYGNVTGRQGTLPFGEDFAESGTQEKHHFTSYERDGESGTDYAVNRFHANGTGRFSQVDPVPGTITDPQSLNRFSYGENDPVNRTDPLGLAWRLALICVVNEGCRFVWVLDPGGAISSGPATPPPAVLPSPPSVPNFVQPGGGQVIKWTEEELKKLRDQCTKNANETWNENFKDLIVQYGNKYDKAGTPDLDVASLLAGLATALLGAATTEGFSLALFVANFIAGLEIKPAIKQGWVLLRFAGAVIDENVRFSKQIQNCWDTYHYFGGKERGP